MSQANKEIALNWFKALNRGDVETARSLTHEQFRYFMPGNMPVSGWHDAAGFFGTMMTLGEVMAGPLTFEVGEVVAEGERVFIEAQSDGPLKSGERYQNVYVMALRIRDGKVAELKEFCDTLHLYQVMDHPQVRGPSKARDRHLQRVTETI